MSRSLIACPLIALVIAHTTAAQVPEGFGPNGLPLMNTVAEPASAAVAAEATSAAEPKPDAAPPAVSVPLLFQYQGYFTQPSGLPLPGPVNLTFTLYNDFSPTPVWTETQNSVALTDGVASPILGGITPIPTSAFSGVPLYIGVRVNGGEELVPRTPLVSLPYAVRSGFTSRLDTDTTGETLRLGQPVNNQPGRLEVFNSVADVASLVTFNSSQGGFIAVRRPDSSDNAVTLNTSDADADGRGAGVVQVFNDRNGLVANVAENDLDGADARFYNSDGRLTLATGVGERNHGYVDIRNRDGAQRIFLGMDLDGNGTVVVNGEKRFDVAEVMEFADAEGIEAGSVVIMDPDDPSRLRLSNRAYDPLVAGVISGAGETGAGLILGSREDGTTDLPLSLTGIAEVWVDADAGAVHPGDMLTTADRPGHAMRASDPVRAFGAVLGKAMGSLENGQGLVPVLVTLH